MPAPPPHEHSDPELALIEDAPAPLANLAEAAAVDAVERAKQDAEVGRVSTPRLFWRFPSGHLSPLREIDRPMQLGENRGRLGVARLPDLTRCQGVRLDGREPDEGALQRPFFFY